MAYVVFALRIAKGVVRTLLLPYYQVTRCARPFRSWIPRRRTLGLSRTDGGPQIRQLVGMKQVILQMAS